MLLIAFAFATPNFPSALVLDLSMPSEPACTVCHATNAGGNGTVTQPFGIALVSRGLGANDTQGLSDALVQLEADGVDSDGDGVTDGAALAIGVDPNTGQVFCGTVLPDYGCFGGGTTAAAGLLLLPGFLRRRR
jgi:hypothetical protein